ncbi:MAG: penicillin-binding protein [Patescibacteria group bacterium]|nr:penicillin-binding protein [Patescibacteria group bacterium]
MTQRKTDNRLWNKKRDVQHSTAPIFPTLLLIPFKHLFKKRRGRPKKIIYAPFSPGMKIKYFVLGSIFSVLFVTIPVTVVVIIQTFPNPAVLSTNLAPQTTKIFDRHGTLLYQIYANQNRTMVALSDIPLYLQQATIAIEDKNFYQNPGFDVQGIIRAALSDLSGKGFQGGSTITQQLIKSSLLSSERSITRKIQEVILAYWAEHMYTKKQILTMYFNQVPYGGTAWGAEAASQTYFGKSVKDLDLAQCAFLAGLPQAPTTYSPFGDNPTLWKQRQKDVLSRMKNLKFISYQQEKDALTEQLQFETPQTPLFAPHFVMYVKNYLIKEYGLELVEKGGLQVTTTLDLKTQDMAQNAVTDEVNKDGELNLTNGAALVTNPETGDILAMVGSRGYDYPDDGNFNVTTAFRQPGSSIKIVTYTAALSNGYTAATIIDDNPVSYPSGDGTYAPVNYDGAFHGPVPLRVAFANSFNIPAVKTLAAIGVPTFVDFGKKMGLSHLGDPSQYGLSATLGAVNTTMVDMATVYGTIANEGKRVDLNPILKVTDNKGTVYEEKDPNIGEQVVNPGVAYILSNILADNNARTWEFGPNSPLKIDGYTVSVKTGTTDEKRDNWTFGYTPNWLVAVWVGNNDNSPMSQSLASGITGAAPIWHTIMSNLLQGNPDEPEPRPQNVVIKPCGGNKTEVFLKGTENTDCSWGATAYPTPSQ